MYPHHVFNLEPAGTFGMYPICYQWVSGRYFQPEPAMYSRCSQNNQMWSQCGHQPNGGNILKMSLDKFQMIANCYGGSNVLHMLILHSKCCINVPTSCVRPGTCRNIWNVPNLLSVGKWQVLSTRACNVLKMFSLISRPPCPQCQWIWLLARNGEISGTRVRGSSPPSKSK